MVSGAPLDSDGRPEDFVPLTLLMGRIRETVPHDEELTFGQFLNLLGVNGFVFFLLVLALLNIAIFMLPGLSIVFGLPMVILCVQMLLGHKAPVFPKFVRDWRMKGAVLQEGLDAAQKRLARIERAVRPRFPVLTSPVALRVHSVTALALAFMVAIPVPFINLPPTFGMVLLAVGIMQRDGAFVLGAYAFAGWSLWLYESLGRAAQGLVG